MRRKVDLSLVLVVLIAAALCVQSPAATAANKPVKVKVKCPKYDGHAFTISVDPFTVIVDPDQGVEWKLDNDDKKNENIEISAENDDAWLYKKKTAKGNKEVVMTEMEDRTPGKAYDYKISVWCGDRVEPVVLDPRVKVGGGGG